MVKMIKFSKGNNHTVQMWLVEGKYSVAVIDEMTNKCVFGDTNLTEEEADILYNKKCFEYGIYEEGK